MAGLGLALGGCGGSGDDPKPRTTADDVRELDKPVIDGISAAQIENFAKIRIPASATDLHSLSRSATDTQLLVSFRIPRADVDGFVRSGSFSGKLTDGDRAIAASAGKQIGWKLDKAKRVRGLGEVKAGLGRNLVVVLDDPKQAAVYLEAMTL